MFIHYGSDHFNPYFFAPVQNSEWQPKPEGGLWASRVDAEYGWEWWCRNNSFNTQDLKTSFRFEMPKARILILESPDQLLTLPLLREWKPKEPLRVEMPTVEELRAWFAPNWCYLDYEKLAEEYDAIELRNSGSFRKPLPTWDCNCVFVMNKDVVEEVP